MSSRQATLNEGWQRILLNQFHDVLPGSSIHEVYDDAARLYAEARSIGENIREESLAFLGEQFNWGKRDVVVLNTLPWSRTDPLHLSMEALEMLRGQVDTQEVADWDGQPFVVVDGFPIPACGTTILTSNIDYGMQAPGSCQIVKAADGTYILSNDHYDLTIDTRGEMNRLYDKRAGRDVFLPGQNGNQLVAYEDRPLDFDAWDIDIFYEEKPYPIGEASKIQVIEEGPVRVTVEIERAYLSSRISQRISLWRCTPRIDIATEIDWHQHQTVLKALFPVDVNSAVATYEIQFGNVQRPTHRNTSWDMARFEVCAHRWADLSEGNYGVSLLNDSKYGHDIHDTMMRLTLLKSGIEPDSDADQGLHRFMYSLLPHQGDWRDAEVVRRAYELNVPAWCFFGKARDDKHKRGTEQSFLRVDCTHVVVETIKPAEDGNGLIVRLYEAHNQRGQGTITFAAPITAAQECNLLEELKGDASFQDNTLYFAVRPFEIKTFRVHLRAL
jgi:alpha-mannosidase